MIVAAPLANLVIRRLGGNADRQEVGGRLNNRVSKHEDAAKIQLRSCADVHNHSHGEGRVKSDV